MADAAITFGATDLFSLGGSFVAQSSSNDDQARFETFLEANGDVNTISTPFDEQDRASATYRYDGGALGTDLPSVGEVIGGYMVDSITISSSNEDYPEVSIEGHKHDDATHASGAANSAQYTIPAGIKTLLTSMTVGVLDFAVQAGATTACTSSTYTLSADHVDVLDCSGDHFAGANYNGSETISCSYVGDAVTTADVIATDTTAWRITSITTETSNEAFETSTLNATRPITRD